MRYLLKHISEVFKKTFAKIKDTLKLKTKHSNKSLNLGLKPLFRFLILSLAAWLLVGKFVACRSPTAYAQDSLANFTLSKPDIQISHSIFVSSPQNKTFQIDISFDYLGNVYYQVGDIKYQIGDIDNTSYPDVSVNASAYGIGDFSPFSIRVSALHTIDADLWEEGITSFEYNATIESTGYGGVHYQFNDAYDLTILFDFNLSTTASIKFVSQPTISYLYNDAVYDKIYNYGYIQGSNVGSRPLKFIANTVNDFLRIELVDGVEVGYLIYLGFGIILFNFVVKLLLGG